MTSFRNPALSPALQSTRPAHEVTRSCFPIDKAYSRGNRLFMVIRNSKQKTEKTTEKNEAYFSTSTPLGSNLIVIYIRLSCLTLRYPA